MPVVAVPEQKSRTTPPGGLPAAIARRASSVG